MPPTTRKRAREVSPEVVENLLEDLSPQSDERDSVSDSSLSLSRDAIVLPWWLKEHSSDRLRAFMEYRDATGRAALSRVPAEADWGKGELASVLCINGRPLQLWVVGVLQTLSHMACESDEYTGCDFDVGLLRDSDREALTKLAAKSRPPPHFPQVVFQTSCTTGGHHSIKLFSDIFDATTTYSDTMTMPRLPASDLVVGDVVLAEARVVRHDIGHRPGRMYGGWMVRFELIRMSKLVSRVLVKDEPVSSNFPVSM